MAYERAAGLRGARDPEPGVHGVGERYLVDDEPEDEAAARVDARADEKERERPAARQADVSGVGEATATATDEGGRRCEVAERRIRRPVEPRPGEAVAVEARHLAKPGSRITLHRAAYEAYRQLKDAAEQAGIDRRLLTIISGYRSEDHQRRLWEAKAKQYPDEEERSRWVARPGTSPHHSGRAIDLYLGGPNDARSVELLRGLKAYRWLVCNAARFGFTPYAREPWHWEYNPPGLDVSAPARQAAGPVRAAPLRPQAPSAPAGAASAAGPAPRDALAAVRALRGEPPSVPTALRLVRAVSEVLGVPWRLAYTVMEHEGGVRAARHPDGAMQTTRGARVAAIPRLPRALKLALLGLPPNDARPDAALDGLLAAEFPRSLAVQLATGTQELRTGLAAFAGYVALALVAYNAGAGWAYWMATDGRAKRRPAGVSPEAWEQACRAAAALYHAPAGEIPTAAGVWQCDANMPGWFQHFVVRERRTGRQLITYKYLRRMTGRIRGRKPAQPCTFAVHGGAHRQAGSGDVVTVSTRPGVLDKLADPRLMRRPYVEAAGAELAPIAQDGRPLKAMGTTLLKAAPGAGPARAARG